MSNIVDTYEDEWVNVVKGSSVSTTCIESRSSTLWFLVDPVKCQQYKQFVNIPERWPQAELIQERGQSVQTRLLAQIFSGSKNNPWPAEDAEEPMNMGNKGDMALSENGTTSVAVKYGNTQLAVYHVPKRGFYATQQMYVELSLVLTLFLLSLTRSL